MAQTEGPEAMWEVWTRGAEEALTRAGVLAPRKEVPRGGASVSAGHGVADGCEGASLLERRPRRGVTWAEEARRLQHEGCSAPSSL
eukprot:8019430-Alexandrium_andersonii.AAC.1